MCVPRVALCGRNGRIAFHEGGWLHIDAPPASRLNFCAPQECRRPLSPNGKLIAFSNVCEEIYDMLCIITPEFGLTPFSQPKAKPAKHWILWLRCRFLKQQNRRLNLLVLYSVNFVSILLFKTLVVSTTARNILPFFLQRRILTFKNLKLCMNKNQSNNKTKFSFPIKKNQIWTSCTHSIITSSKSSQNFKDLQKKQLETFD